jgi:hypothetical protein
MGTIGNGGARHDPERRVAAGLPVSGPEGAAGPTTRRSIGSPDVGSAALLTTRSVRAVEAFLATEPAATEPAAAEPGSVTLPESHGRPVEPSSALSG